MVVAQGPAPPWVGDCVSEKKEVFVVVDHVWHLVQITEVNACACCNVRSQSASVMPVVKSRNTQSFHYFVGELSKRRGCVGGGGTLLLKSQHKSTWFVFQRGRLVFVRGCGGFRQHKQHSRRTWCFEFSATVGWAAQPSCTSENGRSPCGLVQIWHGAGCRSSCEAGDGLVA